MRKDPMRHRQAPLENGALQSVRDAVSPPGDRRVKTRLFLFGTGLMVAAFALLTVLVVTVPAFPIDLNVTLALQSIGSPFFSRLMVFISWVGFTPQSVFAPVIIIVLAYLLGYRWEAASSMISAAAVELLNLLVKMLVHRARPSADLVHVANMLNSFSFPSGHVMFYTGFFGFIGFLIFTVLKPSWIRTLLLFVFGSHVLLIGLSRIYLGEHWASDAVGAYLLGGLCLIGFIRFYRWGKPRFFLGHPAGTDKKQD